MAIILKQTENTTTSHFQLHILVIRHFLELNTKKTGRGIVITLSKCNIVKVIKNCKSASDIKKPAPFPD